MEKSTMKDILRGMMTDLPNAKNIKLTDNKAIWQLHELLEKFKNENKCGYCFHNGIIYLVKDDGDPDKAVYYIHHDSDIIEQE